MDTRHLRRSAISRESGGIQGNDGVKIIMTTALNEERNVKKAFEMGCTVYAGKPIDLEKFEMILKKLNLIN